MLDFSNNFKRKPIKIAKFFFAQDIGQTINRELFRIKRCICACCVGAFHQPLILEYSDLIHLPQSFRRLK